MASTSEIAKRYFEALDAHDLDAAVALWEPGAIDRFVGQQDLTAPQGVREYFASLFTAFPDFSLQVLDVTASRNRAAVRWRGRGTFAGPGTFQGFEPNGAAIEIEGCDVLTVAEDKITHNDAYVDSGDIARKLGFLPPAGSPAETRLTKLANVRTRVRGFVGGAEPEQIADGVSIIRGGFPLKTMNVYFIADGDGVTMFDAGIKDMTTALRIAGVRAGGIKRVVLGHADGDHRGAAPGLDVPTYCHPIERPAAESESPYRDYFDFSKLAPPVRAFYSRMLRLWDGGAVKIAGTVAEGDEVAGFRVIELPGHAPGQIGLFRESDRLALVSDAFYTLDIRTGIKGPARVPHPAFDADVEQARASLRKLAALRPSVAWAGHAEPVRGDVSRQRQRAAGDSMPEAASRDYRDGAGNVLILRGSLTAATRQQYARTLAGGFNREDAWQRATEFLFERLAVSWTIAGLELTSQRELLGRFRMASGDERRFVRDALREHLEEHFPELEAP